MQIRRVYLAGDKRELCGNGSTWGLRGSVGSTDYQPLSVFGGSTGLVVEGEPKHAAK
jgi:hypothetical protein